MSRRLTSRTTLERNAKHWNSPEHEEIISAPSLRLARTRAEFEREAARLGFSVFTGVAYPGIHGVVDVPGHPDDGTVGYYHQRRSGDEWEWVRVGNKPVRSYVQYEHVGNVPERFDGRMTPNGGAMDMSIGVEIDPDGVDGKAGHDLDEAFNLYEKFHTKKVRRVVDLQVTIPKELICVGDCLSSMYRTDKWNKDGDDIDYKHVHDLGENKEYPPGDGVKFYENARIATPLMAKLAKKKAGGVVREDLTIARCGPPVSYPHAVSVLGKCLGFFVRRYDDGEIYECTPRNTYLLGSPKSGGNMLIVYSRDPRPKGSILGVMAGGRLRILKDGIDG